MHAHVFNAATFYIMNFLSFLSVKIFAVVLFVSHKDRGVYTGQYFDKFYLVSALYYVT